MNPVKSAKLINGALWKGCSVGSDASSRKIPVKDILGKKTSSRDHVSLRG